MSHTKGPWKIVDDPDNNGGWDRIEVAHNRFVTVEGLTEEEANANVLLIAAAPELLAALKESLRWTVGHRQTPAQRGAKCETLNEAETMIIKAIAKAEGRV